MGFLGKFTEPCSISSVSSDEDVDKFFHGLIRTSRASITFDTVPEQGAREPTSCTGTISVFVGSGLNVGDEGVGRECRTGVEVGEGNEVARSGKLGLDELATWPHYESDARKFSAALLAR